MKHTYILEYFGGIQKCKYKYIISQKLIVLNTIFFNLLAKLMIEMK